MPDYKQAGRLMQFASVLGQDELLIDSLEGVEGLSRLFDFEAELLADADADIDPSALIGNKATVSMALLDVSGTRYFNGVVAALEQTSGDDEFNWYRAHLVPSLWLLTLSTNCRVFQDKIPMDIIKAVIGPYGLSLADNTAGSYNPLDYCTQYNETDFNFISRIAEQFGIFYWFEHSNGDNKVCFGDDRSAYSACPEVSDVQYSPQSARQEDFYHSVVNDLRVTASMVTGKYTAWDYDHLTYLKNDNGSQNSSHPLGGNALESYSYPVGESPYVKLVSKELTNPAHGTIILSAKRDAGDVPANQFHGSSTARTFVPGFTFDLTEHPRAAWNQTYLLTEVVHHADQSPPYKADQAASATPYTNRVVAIESTRIFRPQVRTPKPRIAGPQTAMVVGGASEEIVVDKQGRVCVQFFWGPSKGSEHSRQYLGAGEPVLGRKRQRKLLLAPRK